MRTAERKMELGLIAPRNAAWQNVVAGMSKGFVTFLRRILNRVSANSLIEMDDRQLADIGVTRLDLERALNTGLLEDPTTHLAHAAKARAPARFTNLRKP